MISSTDAALKHFFNNQKVLFANTQQIEHALALHEKGTRFDPKYTKLYKELVDSSSKVRHAIVQKGAARLDPKLLKLHRELDAKLLSLSKRMEAASQPQSGLSKRAKMGCYALAAGVAAIAAYYFFKTRATEETLKRVFDIGLGVKEEVLDTSRCTRSHAWSEDNARICVTTRTTIHPDSLNQWLAETKTCVDTIPSYAAEAHKWCHIPLWDPAEKSELLSKGQKWIQSQEWYNCSANNGRPAQEECAVPPKDSSFRTIQAKKTFDAYSKLVDRHCKEHACQRLSQACDDSGRGSLSCHSRNANPFARDETQEELLEMIWNQTPYPQTPERVRAIALEEALPKERWRYRWTAKDLAEHDQALKDLDGCIEQQKCGPETKTFENAYCVKSKCAAESRRFFEKLNALPLEFGRQFWSEFPAKIRELCPAQSCEVSNYQIIDTAEVLRMELMNESPETIESVMYSETCNRFPKASS